MKKPNNSPNNTSGNSVKFTTLADKVNSKINSFQDDSFLNNKFNQIKSLLKFPDPVKPLLCGPVASGFFANFLALYAVLKIFSLVNADRVKYPGSLFPITRPHPLQAFVDKFETICSSCYSAIGFNTDNYKFSETQKRSFNSIFDEFREKDYSKHRDFLIDQRDPDELLANFNETISAKRDSNQIFI